jgi:hypothetical protein
MIMNRPAISRHLTAIVAIALSLVAPASIYYFVWNGLWILLLLLIGVAFFFLIMESWRRGSRREAAGLFVIYFASWLGTVLLGMHVETIAKKQAEVILVAAEKYSMRLGKQPTSVQALKPEFLPSSTSDRRLAGGIQLVFGLWPNHDEACLIRESFPIGTRIRCASWNSERTLND